MISWEFKAVHRILVASGIFFRKYCISIARIRRVPSFRQEWPHQFLPLVFSVRILYRPCWTFPWRLCCYFTPIPRKEWSTGEKLGWISCIAAFVLKLLLGFVCFSYKPEHVGITDHSQICSHPPHTNKKEKEPLLFPFFAQLRSLRSFLWSRRAKEVN